MNWARPEKRLTIYLRDRLTCQWCLKHALHVDKMTLDHVKAKKLGGTNDPKNLVACCKSCNDSKGDLGIIEFALKVSQKTDESASQILRRIRSARDRSLRKHTAKARILIEDHGSFRNALVWLLEAPAYEIRKKGFEAYLKR